MISLAVKKLKKVLNENDMFSRYFYTNYVYTEFIQIYSTVYKEFYGKNAVTRNPKR